MKTRNGFVSNSSSSSYIIIAKKEDIHKALNSIKNENIKKLIKDKFDIKNECKKARNIYGMKLVCLSNIISSEEFYCEDEDADISNVFEELNYFMKTIEKFGGFTNSQEY